MPAPRPPSSTGHGILARQFGGQGVTVNNLAPGAILTARNRAQMATEGEALVQRIPAGRLGKPDDLAGAALLLCSDAGAYINGINLYVDGGRSIVGRGGGVGGGRRRRQTPSSFAPSRARVPRRLCEGRGDVEPCEGGGRLLRQENYKDEGWHGQSPASSPVAAWDAFAAADRRCAPFSMCSGQARLERLGPR